MDKTKASKAEEGLDKPSKIKPTPPPSLLPDNINKIERVFKDKYKMGFKSIVNGGTKAFWSDFIISFMFVTFREEEEGIPQLIIAILHIL